jgi:hypothetical protein
VQQITTDDLNHILVLKPIDGKLNYYFLAAWEKEHDGLKNQSEFEQYMKEVVDHLNHPFEIIIN